MFFSDSVFVGIDPTSSQKSYTFAALDKGLNLVALSDGELDDIVAFLGGQQSAVVAVNAPSGVNRGVVREKLKKAMLTPHQIRAAEYRLAEYELRERGITVTGTPANQALSPGWMQAGFVLYRKLNKMGFAKYPAGDAPHQVLETHPHACFCVLAGDVPLPKLSLEGKLQRQLILYERGVRISDPMEFFEEITRFRVMKGAWALELLYLPEQLDALVAAYTAWLASNKPDEVSFIGDQKEGLILLPGPNLKEKY